MGSGTSKCTSSVIREKIASVSEKEPFRVLLLGVSDSGKSTVAKQMSLIFTGGFPEAQKKKTIVHVHLNTMEFIQGLIQYCRDKQIDLEDEVCTESAEMIASGVLFLDKASLGKCIVEVWGNQILRDTAKNLPAKMCVFDSANYFMEKVVESFDPAYQPSDEDVLRVRKASTGVTNVIFTADGLHIDMLDVGGLRGERLAWNRCLKQGVGALFYVVSLSDYDMMLTEDDTRNRLVESVKVFGSISGNFSKDMPVVLFLNKEDLYREKIKKVNIGDYHPDYKGAPNDYDAGIAYFTKIFSDTYAKQRKESSMDLIIHVTSATSKEAMMKIWSEIQTVLEDSKVSALMKDAKE